MLFIVCWRVDGSRTRAIDDGIMVMRVWDKPSFREKVRSSAQRCCG